LDLSWNSNIGGKLSLLTKKLQKGCKLKLLKITDCNLTAKDGESLGMCIHPAGLRLASQQCILFDLEYGCIELNISGKLIYFRLCIITVFTTLYWDLMHFLPKTKAVLSNHVG